MQIAEYFIKNKVISWMVTLICLIGGTLAYFSLGQLEDPKFTIKDAMVITQYPGASPRQVEEEVTYPIEKAIRQLSYVDEINSISTRGLSQITVTMKNIYGPDELPQIWDELRRKVSDLTPTLSPGVRTPQVNDDFGDVFGVMMMVYGDGYSYKDLQDYVKFLRRELELINGIGKVSIKGNQQEQVFIEISRKKLSALSISPNEINNILTNQNLVSLSGAVKHNDEYISFHSSGEFVNVKQLEDLIITGLGSDKLVYLRDFATVTRGFKEVPTNLYRYNGKDAINIGISFSDGVNVVHVGKAIAKRLQELEPAKPLGVSIDTIYSQPTEVDKSVSGFILSLIEAIAIVIVVLLIFMGVKSGILIGIILLLTILGTFIIMSMYDIDLHRISLGALIIALGMLVDNAIVVTEGIIIGIQRGKTKLEAASAIVKQTMWPLLGATAIAITAFAPIGLSDDSTGEFAGSLFWVLFISLLLSWFTAISLTPFIADLFFKEGEGAKTGDSSEEADPYKGAIFTGYKWLLDLAMKYRWPTAGLMFAMLVGSIYGFSNVKQSFFPFSNTPIYLIDYWLPQGTDIRKTKSDLNDIEQFILTHDVVEQVSSTTGQGAQRFMLTYSPEKQYANYAQIIVRVNEYSDLIPMVNKTKAFISANYPNAKTKAKFLEIGPSSDAKIEARFVGPDPEVLRNLAEQARVIFQADPGTRNIRDNWQERTKLLQPQFNESLARRAGISRKDLDDLLQMTFSGQQIGLYRDGADLLPIVSRPPAEERVDVDNINSLQIWSPTLEQYIPIQQVAPEYKVTWEDPIIMRRDRKREITVMADNDIMSNETAAQVFTRIRPLVEAIELPVGYEFSWGGEYESSTDAQAALGKSMPMGYLIMFLITVFLFNSVRQPLVIWACVPLAIVGVTIGLLVMRESFGFMALLGMLSLSGMLLKNGIVLLDQINTEIAAGTEKFKAVFISAVSRVRPVGLAALTTILGMVPLLGDPFFVSMAVTIMFGLGFATILTLIVVPVFYVLFHNIDYQKVS